jgi:hypothetical protein
MRSALFWDFTQLVMVVITDVSVQPIGPSSRVVPKERRSNVSILDWYAVCVCAPRFILWTNGVNCVPLNASAIHFKFLQTVIITWRSRERVRRKNSVVIDFMIVKWCMVIDLKEYSFTLGNIFVECKITR